MCIIIDHFSQYFPFTSSRVDTIENDDINPVWCFLENIREPSDPQSGCYSDTQWSSSDGRFWSSEACKGLPPLSVKGNEQLPVSQIVHLKFPFRE